MKMCPVTVKGAEVSGESSYFIIFECVGYKGGMCGWTRDSCPIEEGKDEGQTCAQE